MKKFFPRGLLDYWQRRRYEEVVGESPPISKPLTPEELAEANDIVFNDHPKTPKRNQ